MFPVFKTFEEAQNFLTNERVSETHTVVYFVTVKRYMVVAKDVVTNPDNRLKYSNDNPQNT